MRTHRVVVFPGDGIGPEIVDAALEVLRALEDRSGGFRLELEFHRAGAALYRETGEAILPEGLEAFRRAGCAFKGPVGLPEVRRPDGTEAGLLGGVLRGGFDLFANVRPISLLPGVRPPLAGVAPGDVDYVIVRENTEGLYLSRGLGLVTRQAAADTLLLTASGCERISRFAFRTALSRPAGAPADGKRRVTLVEKSNVLRSFAFFRRIFLEVSSEFPGVEADCLYVDAAAAALVSRPQDFQVIVTENLFGDILSDLGAATVGGLGFCAAANIGEHAAYFEPIHGSAPAIAGQGLANPLSQIRAGALMLDYLGEKEAAAALEQAVRRACEGGGIRFTREGCVEGGPIAAAAAVKEALRAD
ncbi:MAG: isocitrate/isopropylmalate family dehydrogenase [Desulfobacterales bacterium]